ncbi:hypothetical protein HMPREF9996_01341 [Aggregatibacter actinomycetemcomitans Y4]|nr:hypothetical protein HMPREF9996_01341 [Aggregatibacter actinomycetemcomitans Y4]
MRRTLTIVVIICPFLPRKDVGYIVVNSQNSREKITDYFSANYPDKV